MAASSARRAKVALLADLLRGLSDPELAIVVPWLCGTTRQRRTGIGWAGLRDLPPATSSSSLTVLEVDARLSGAADLGGAGSALRRRDEVAALMARATTAEQQFLVAVLLGELRQGAQAGLVTDAVSAASGLPTAAVRRAVTLRGDLAEVALQARSGAGALAALGIRVGTPLAPMLAGSEPDIAQALARTGPAVVEAKLDGVRIQVHRDGDDIAVFSRSLDDITARMPETVAAARALPVTSVVLDGEAIALTPAGRPRPFQETASRAATTSAGGTGLTPALFDLLHLDGADLIDEPVGPRHEHLLAVAPPELLVPRLLVGADGPIDPTAGESFAAGVLAAGHEGVVVKALDAPYAMGRRGAGWIKVKPRHTLDLVVLAAEWGHGRRRGLLSNLHLGARDPLGDHGPAGGFVMLGKTFKGLTDAMLAWQTEHLQTIATGTDGWAVTVTPTLVVEIAFDGVQTSPRYPAGMALRFARVIAHRPDKPASQADTLAAVRAHHEAR